MWIHEYTINEFEIHTLRWTLLSRIFSQPYKISHYSFLWVQSTQPNRHKTRNIVFAFIRGQTAVMKVKKLFEFKLFLAICNLTFPFSKIGFHLVKTCKKSPSNWSKVKSSFWNIEKPISMHTKVRKTHFLW